MESNLLYLKATDLNVNLFRRKQKKAFSATSRLVGHQVSVYRGLAKLTHKMNHHI